MRTFAGWRKRAHVLALKRYRQLHGVTLKEAKVRVASLVREADSGG